MIEATEHPCGRWRYTLNLPMRFALPFLPSTPATEEFAAVDSMGTLSVRAGYAWDGCSFAWDGRRGRDGLPITWRASLIHDALYQYFIGPEPTVYTRKQADRCFLRQLRQDGFILRGIYYTGARLFGGVFHSISNTGKQG